MWLSDMIFLSRSRLHVLSPHQTAKLINSQHSKVWELRESGSENPKRWWREMDTTVHLELRSNHICRPSPKRLMEQQKCLINEKRHTKRIMGTLLLKVTKRQKTTRAFERCQVLLHPLVWASPLTAWHLCWSMDNNLGSKEVVRQHVLWIRTWKWCWWNVICSLDSETHVPWSSRCSLCSSCNLWLC